MNKTRDVWPVDFQDGPPAPPEEEGVMRTVSDKTLIKMGKKAPVGPTRYRTPHTQRPAYLKWRQFKIEP